MANPKFKKISIKLVLVVKYTIHVHCTCLAITYIYTNKKNYIVHYYCKVIQIVSYQELNVKWMLQSQLS